MVSERVPHDGGGRAQLNAVEIAAVAGAVAGADRSRRARECCEESSNKLCSGIDARGVPAAGGETTVHGRPPLMPRAPR